jgi:photosystem II stability/assembly factor-like uncharacterized protein
MASTTHVYAGAARWRANGRLAGVFRMAADEGRWEHLTKGLPEDAFVHAITVHPQDANIVFVGTQDGPYRSTDRGATWERLGFPDRNMQVWSIQVHPARPRTIYCGTSPVAVYRSDDGGDNWRLLSKPQMPDRCKMPFPARVMRFGIDAARPDDMFAPLEVNGLMRSRDGGESWQDCSADLLRLAQSPHLKSRLASDVESEGMLDCHALAVSAADPGAVYVALRMGLFRSGDGGETWQDMEVGRFSHLRYARDIRVSPQDPRTLYACLSVAAASDEGSLSRSRDLGKTWQRFDRGMRPRSTMMAVALNHQNADEVYALTREGQAIGTRDGGQSWREYHLPEGCQDFYAMACG